MRIQGPTLFFFTSPRTPIKMRPEIDLLVREFHGQRWIANRALQTSFMKKLARLPEFEGSCNQKNLTLSARDRITRGPKSLGLVDLRNISLTPAGERFFDDDLIEEALLRQMVKFQLPSPFHETNPKIAKLFCIRPYLELLRLVKTLGRLSFDELTLFGMRLTDWHDFDKTVEEIRRFRIGKERNKGRYRKFLNEQRDRFIAEAFRQQISQGRLKTRESPKVSLDHFIKTKAGNLRDYADACVRHLRATGLVTVSNPGRTISIIESRRDELDFILKTVERNPVFVNDEEAYCRHLFNADMPRLLTDNRAVLAKKAVECHAVETRKDAKAMETVDLKKAIRMAKVAQRQGAVNAQVTELKAFTRYDEVVSMLGSVRSRDVYDPPLAFEWNVWRAMTMMDGGDIRANLTFDDAGNPLSTAPGNNPDILCDYGDFTVTVEVTLQAGSKQYDAEGEPVARHLGDVKAKTHKDAYCLFIAPTINPSVISHFYMLHKTNVRHYGGKSVIVPITLKRFVGMLKQSRSCGYIPSPEKVRSFCEFSKCAAQTAADEEDWYAKVSAKADSWLT